MKTTGSDVTEVVPDEGRKDSKGRVTYDEARREALLSEFMASGVSQAKFARRAGLTYSTFAGWVQRRRKGGAESTTPAHRSLKTPRRTMAKRKPMTPERMGFREVAVSRAPVVSGLFVALPGGVGVICPDVATAAALIRALREDR